jgi:DNA-binding IclR family transcriptional regulator
VVLDGHAEPLALRATDRSITTVPELIAELDRTRQRGYSIDDEETTPGIVCFAVPVGGESGPGRFAIRVTMLQARLEDSFRDALLADLRTIAAGMGNPMQPTRRARSMSSAG